MNEFPIVEGPSGDYMFAPDVSIITALEAATADGSVTIKREVMSETQSFYRVELSDGDEWGDGPTLEIALRYALGAHYAPVIA